MAWIDAWMAAWAAQTAILHWWFAVGLATISIAILKVVGWRDV
jgi:hypothetical protein